MRPDKAKAIKLRLRGISYNEIVRILGVPKSTLSGWFSKNEDSKKIKEALIEKTKDQRIKKLIAANSEKWEKWREAARKEAVEDFKKLSTNSLFIAGLMVYWSEGDSKPWNPIRFANTDSRMVSLYTKFLKEILKVNIQKIKIGLILYPDLQESQCINFWSQVTAIPQIQFHKTQYIQGRHKTARLKHGICMVVYFSRQLKEKMLIWIDLLSKML